MKDAHQDDETLRARIKVAVVDGQAETRRHVSGLLAQSPSLMVEALANDADDTPTLRAHDVLLIGLDTNPQDALAVVKRVLAQTPACGVIVFGGAAAINTVLQAMAAGARRYLPYPFDGPALHAAICEVSEETKLLVGRLQQVTPSHGGAGGEPGADTSRGQVIAAFSPKGGVGTTTLAVNLACALTTLGRRVVIVDANVSFGTVGLFLNIAPSKNILHVVDDAAGLQEAMIDDVLHPHPSGLKVMLAPLQPEDAESIRAEHLRAILAVLKARYDYVVVDTWPSYDDRVLAILEVADQVLVPTGPELTSIKNLAAFLRVAQLLGYPDEKLIPILMRSDSVSAAHQKGIEDYLGRRLAWQIVSDGRRVTASVNESQPFVLTDRDATVSQDVYKVARMLDGQEQMASAPVARRRPFWKQPQLAFVKAHHTWRRKGHDAHPQHDLAGTEQGCSVPPAAPAPGTAGASACNRDTRASVVPALDGVRVGGVTESTVAAHEGTLAVALGLLSAEEQKALLAQIDETFELAGPDGDTALLRMVLSRQAVPPALLPVAGLAS